MKSKIHIGLTTSEKKLIDFLQILFSVKVTKKLALNKLESYYWLLLEDHDLLLEIKVIKDLFIGNTITPYHIGLHFIDINEIHKIHQNKIKKNKLQKIVQLSDIKKMNNNTCNYFLTINNELLIEIVEEK